MKLNRILVAASAMVAILGVSQAQAAPWEEKLARKSGCFKCHAVDKKKDGPSYKEIAEKYKDDSQALDKLFEHATTEPMVEIGDKEEKHKTLKTDDAEEIRAVMKWILSQ